MNYSGNNNISLKGLFRIMEEDLLKNSLKRYLKTGSFSVRKSIANRKDLPLEIMRILAKDEHKYIRKELAKRENLPIELVQFLADDDASEVREEIAARNDLSVKLITKLATDNEKYVRAKIASRKQLSKTLLKKLVCDPEGWVKQAVAAREDLSRDLIVSLVKDKDDRVIKVIEDRSDLDDGIRSMIEGIRKESAKMRMGDFDNQEILIKEYNESGKGYVEILPIELMEKIINDKDKGTRCYLADVPDLPMKILKKLANDPENDVKERLALRNNLPLEIISILAKEGNTETKKRIIKYQKWSPEMFIQIMGNVNYDFRKDIKKFIEDKNLLSNELIKKMSNDPNRDIRLFIASYKFLPSNLIEELANDSDEYIRRAIAKREDLTQKVVKILAKDSSWWILREIVVRDDAPLELVEKLAEGDDRDLEAVAKRKELPMDIIIKLAKHYSDKVREAIAVNKDLPLEIIGEFLADKNRYGIPRNIASRDDLPLVLMNKFISDDRFKEQLAKNISLPPDLVSKLAYDPSAGVRKTIAEREDLPVHLMMKLVGDSNKDVKLALTRRKNLPIEVMDYLARQKYDVKDTIIDRVDLQFELFEKFIINENYYYDNDASNYFLWLKCLKKDHMNFELLRELVKKNNNSLDKDIAKIKNLPEDIIEKLSKSNNWFTRKMIAERENLPLEIMRKLAYDEAFRVRISISQRGDLPPDLIEYFKRDIILKIKKRLLEVEYLPTILTPDVLNILILDEDEYIKIQVTKAVYLPEEFQDKLAKDKNKHVRKYLSLRNDLSTKIIETLASDSFVEVRRNIAKLDKLPSNVINKFSKDSDDKVKTLIASRNDIPIDLIEDLVLKQSLPVKNVTIDLGEFLCSGYVAHNLANFMKTPRKRRDDFYLCYCRGIYQLNENGFQIEYQIPDLRSAHLDQYYLGFILINIPASSLDDFTFKYNMIGVTYREKAQNLDKSNEILRNVGVDDTLSFKFSKPPPEGTFNEEKYEISLCINNSLNREVILRKEKSIKQFQLNWEKKDLKIPSKYQIEGKELVKLGTKLGFNTITAFKNQSDEVILGYDKFEHSKIFVNNHQMVSPPIASVGLKIFLNCFIGRLKMLKNRNFTVSFEDNSPVIVVLNDELLSYKLVLFPVLSKYKKDFDFKKYLN
ncbi:MAG: hypothetical protein EAX96_18625 [Candidatus Lokiarchaeota archaeon]|nr:hypothetical protein [Candidatus Lokiarchaeota archaeon]